MAELPAWTPTDPRYFVTVGTMRRRTSRRQAAIDGYLTNWPGISVEAAGDSERIKIGLQAKRVRALPAPRRKKRGPTEMSPTGNYFRTLTSRFGQGWNRFWFAPSDPTTLCVIRILTAAVALYLYLTYLPDLNRFFGPGGLLSRDAMLQLRGKESVFSIFDYATTTSTLWIFYWAGTAALVAMLLGLFTRVSTVLALVAVLSLIHRGPVLADRPVDDIMAMLMFYLCFGPCGRGLSLDALFRSRSDANASATLHAPAASSYGATISTRIIQVHLTLIYLAMAMAKLHGSLGTDIWWNGTAVWDLIRGPNIRCWISPRSDSPIRAGI